MLPAEGHVGSKWLSWSLYFLLFKCENDRSAENCWGSREGTSKLSSKELCEYKLFIHLLRLWLFFHDSDHNRDLCFCGKDSRTRLRKITWKCQQTRKRKVKRINFVSEVAADAFSIHIELKIISACWSRDWPRTIGAHSLQLAGEGQGAG